MKLFSVFCCLFLFVACMTPAQQSAALEVLDIQLKNGTITREQWEVMRQTILQGGTAAFWQQLLMTGVGMLTTYAGIQWRRNATAEVRVTETVKKLLPNATLAEKPPA